MLFFKTKEKPANDIAGFHSFKRQLEVISQRQLQIEYLDLRRHHHL